MKGAEPRIDLPLARGRRLRSDHTLVVGILNATPDSFSDGGLLADPGALDTRIRAMLAEGADLLDVGGESTRPGHAAVPAAEEMRRILPVLGSIRRIDADVPVSVDTRKAAVAQAALDAGADLVNDVSALADPAMADVVRAARCGVVLMRNAPCRGDVVAACRRQLDEAVHHAVAAGIDGRAIVVDPGLGFGDPPGGDPGANLALVDRLQDAAGPRPALVGASRKRFVGRITGIDEPTRRVHGSVAVAVLAALRGAALVRVHDVAATVQAIRVVRGIPSVQ